jgi:glutaconate CoA-transferase subunit A
MPYEYFSDEEHVRHWLAAEKNMDSFRDFLETHIYGVSDFAEYLQHCGGLPRMQELRRHELLLHRASSSSGDRPQ